MRASLFTLLFLFVLKVTYGQTITVTDKDTGKALPGVIISTAGKKVSAETDASGFAELSNIGTGEPLQFSLMGYRTLSMSLEKLQAQNFLVQLEPGLIQLDQTVVAASRWQQSSEDVPSKITVVSSRDLLLRAPANTADWLGSKGDIFIQKSQQGGGSPMIRGFSANRLLYAVDGVRMNTAIFRSGNLHNVISLDPFATERAEVLFGPGSVMYGSDAIGGVMSFETLRPAFSGGSTILSGNILSRYGSANNEITFHADVAISTKRWAFLTSISRFDYGDLKMGTHGPDDYLRPYYAIRENGVDTSIQNDDPRVQVQSGYQQLNLMQKIRYQVNENSDLEYAFHYSRTGNIPRYDRLIEGTGPNLRFARWDYGPQVWMMNNLGYNLTGSSRLFDQAKIKIAHQFFEESRIDRRTGSSNLANRSEEVNALSLNADFVKTIRNNSFFSYGTEWVYNKVFSQGSILNIMDQTTSIASSRYPQSDWTSLAAYGTYQLYLSGKATLHTGVRYNYISLLTDFSNNRAFYPLPFDKAQTNFGSLTGSLGLVYKPTETLTVSPLVSTGFRAPNVDDLGKIFDSQPGSVLVPNPNLRPEYAYNAELNLNALASKQVKIDLTGFFTLLDNAMVRRPFALDGESFIEYDGELSQVLAIQNASSARVYGIQAGLEWALSSRFLLTSRYNWQRGTEELDDESRSPSRHAAPAFGLTRLTYSLNRVKIELSSLYSASVPFDRMPQEERGKPLLYVSDDQGRPYSPSWVIVNLNSSLQISRSITFTAGIENIGDSRYRPYSSGLAAPGRNFVFSLKGGF